MNRDGVAVDLDEPDRKILSVLRQDSRITFSDLAQKIRLSKPCVRRLFETGVIVGVRAILDPLKVGLDHIAFTEVKLSDTREAALDEFNAAVRFIPELEECHMIASSFDYVVKVSTPDICRYRSVLSEKIPAFRTLPALRRSLRWGSPMLHFDADWASTALVERRSN